MADFIIESETNFTQSKLNNLFEFLIDFKNFKTLLPEDKTDNFELSNEEIKFNIKGLMPISVKIVEKKTNEFIIFSAFGLAKLTFNLKVYLIGEAQKNGQCKIEVFGNLNPIVKSMAEKSLKQLVNTMSDKLSQLKIDS